MRPAFKELEYEPRKRPPKSRKRGRKLFGIEYRGVPSAQLRMRWGWKSNNVWSRWNRYHTEKQRDAALHDLRAKGPHKFKLLPDRFYEYRKEPNVKFKPLHDKVVIEYTPPKDRTEGGILLPDICKTPPTKALVVQAGPGRRAENGELIPMPCQAGDQVLVSISGIELENPDEDSKSKIRLVDAEDILAVYNV